jgi:thiazole/oxazole-forming peptide maturase SagC family component
MKKNQVLPRKPKVRDYFFLIPMGEKGLQVRTIDNIFMMRGKAVSELFPALLPLLNGEYEIDDIVSRLKDFSEEVVVAAVNALNKKGILEDASDRPSSGISSEEAARYERQVTLFSQFHEDRYAYQEKLKNSKVTIFGLGQVGTHLLSSLALSGVGHLKVVEPGNVETKDLGSFFLTEDVGKSKCQAAGSRIALMNPHTHPEFVSEPVDSAQGAARFIDGSDFVVVCQDHPAVSIFRWINEACLEKKIPWTSACLEGYRGRVGAAVLPYETACYTCYELRVKSNERFYEEYVNFEEYLKTNPDCNVEYGSLYCFAPIIANYAALEIIKALTYLRVPVTYGRVHTMNFLDLAEEVSDVLKIPKCPTCTRMKPKPVLWDGEEKTRGGG